MTGFDLRDLAPRGHRRRRYVLPGLAIVASEVDQTVVSADPDRSCLERRGADGIHHAEAVRHSLIDVFGSEGIESTGNGRVQLRKVGTDFFPSPAAVP